MAGRVPDAEELLEDLRRIEAAVEKSSRETREAINALAQRIESTYVRQDVYEAHRSGLAGRVKNLEERHTWVSRTAVTALILPIAVIVIAAILVGSGVR